jgi:hypothetical protein
MSAIRVVCRLRPMPNQQDPKANIQLSGGSNNSNPCVLVTQPERPSVKSQRGRTQNKEHVAFPVDAVLGDNAGQGAVFNVGTMEQLCATGKLAQVKRILCLATIRQTITSDVV